MTFPPPPPDRMHLQYQPAPPPQTGPGGAYGPMQQRPDQPLPGQLPPPSTTMAPTATLASGQLAPTATLASGQLARPGSITGIQVILWIFMALGAAGDLYSAISLVDYFSVWGLAALALAVYSTIQSLASGVHITRGKRWAWIWALVSAILGLTLAVAVVAYGFWAISRGGEYMLMIGFPLGGLYLTLLLLLSSKSARQWILMHRVQRGEVPMPAGAAFGTPAAAGFAQRAPAQPERPAVRPGAVGLFTAVALLTAALGGWAIYAQLQTITDMSEYGVSIWQGRSFTGSLPPYVHVASGAVLLIGGLIAAPLVFKGSFGGRVFGIVWAVCALVGTAAILLFVVIDYGDGLYDAVIPGQVDPAVPAFAWAIGRFALVAAVLVLLLVPGVKAWTPPKPASLVLVVPGAQPPGPPQVPPGPQQYAPPGPQQQPYSPQPPYSGY